MEDEFEKYQSFEWIFNRDENTECRFCGGKVINEMQINREKAGICDYRARCTACNKEHIKL